MNSLIPSFDWYRGDRAACGVLIFRITLWIVLIGLLCHHLRADLSANSSLLRRMIALVERCHQSQHSHRTRGRLHDF